MRDALKCMRQEWMRSADPFAATPRDAALNLAAALFVMIFVPWLTGLGFLDALVIIPYALLSIFFVAVLTAAAFGGTGQLAEMRTLTAHGSGYGSVTWGRMAGVSFSGWCFGMSTLAGSLAAVNAMNWHGVPLLPNASILLDAVLLSLAACLFVAAGGALVALRAKSVKSAQLRLRTVLMALILAGMALFGQLPEAWRSAWNEKLTTQGIGEMTWFGCGILLVAAAILSDVARRTSMTLTRTESSPPIPYRIRIGVTGHRKLPDAERFGQLIRKALDDHIDALFDEKSIRAIRGARDYAPVAFSIVSPLAEGADRLVATEVLAREGAVLEAVLPLALEDYLDTFAEGSHEEFEKLLGQCRRPVSLHTQKIDRDLSPDEARKIRHKAFSKVGKYVVNNCDVLIALWDKQPGRPGGTAEVVDYAVRSGRPVIRIWTDTETPEVRRGHGLNAESLHGMHLFTSFLLDPEFVRVERDKLESKHLQVESAQAIPPPIADAIRSCLFPFYVRASAMAKENQTKYRWAGTAGYLLSAAAVAAVALGTLFEQLAVLAYLMELGILIVILVVVWLAERNRNSEKWMESRFLTERLRAAIFMAASGVEVSRIKAPPYMGQAEHPDDWMVRVFNEIWNRMPKLQGSAAQDGARTARYVGEEWLKKQIAFHENKKIREGKSGANLRWWSKALVFVTLGAAVAHLGFHYFEVHVESLNEVLTLVAIVFPALAAALAALRSHREHARLEKRSANMIPRLRQLAGELADARDPEDFEEVLREVEVTMLQEAQDWLMLMSLVAIDAG